MVRNPNPNLNPNPNDCYYIIYSDNEKVHTNWKIIETVRENF